MKFHEFVDGSTVNIRFNDDEGKYYFGRSDIVALTNSLRRHQTYASRITIGSDNPHIFSLGFDPARFQFESKALDDIAYGMGLGQALVRQLAESPVPIEADVRGICIGAGLEFALACRSIQIAPHSRIQFPEFQAGWLTGYGGIYLFAKKFGQSLALQHILNGQTLRGSRLQTEPQKAIDGGEIARLRRSVEPDLLDIIDAPDLVTAQERSTAAFLFRIRKRFNRV